LTLFERPTIHELPANSDPAWSGIDITDMSMQLVYYQEPDGSEEPVG
jgi:hypothetical protein